MSEFRQNVTTGEWVIISNERSKRPHDFIRTKDCPRDFLEAFDKTCPFCKGTKEEQELKVVYDNKNENKVRIVSNKFSALSEDVVPKREIDGLFIKAGGYGFSDVVIESPLHDKKLAFLSDTHFFEIIKAYKIRANQLSSVKNINLINIFKNYGRRAGASLYHPHSQIIGSMIVPPHIEYQVEYARKSFNTYGNCIYCDMIIEEIKKKIRIVEENDSFVAICPFASKSPYELRILPKKHSSVFGNIAENEMKDFSLIIKNILQRIYILLDNPDYNFIIRSIMTYDGEVPFYHWYMVIIPRLTRTAGFEMGTGIYINITEPEKCAENLKSVKLIKGEV